MHVLNLKIVFVITSFELYVFQETDFHRRAEMTLDTADVLKCRAFIAPTVKSQKDCGQKFDMT